MRTITADDALVGLRYAVAEKGADYVYPDRNPCVYVEINDSGDRRPSCIVGHALYYLGVPLNEIGRDGRNSKSVQSLDLSDDGFALTVGAVMCLKAAQDMQDLVTTPEHSSWGAALAAAQRVADASRQQY